MSQLNHDKRDIGALIRAMTGRDRPMAVMSRSIGTLVVIGLFVVLQIDGSPYVSTFVEQIGVNACLGLAVVMLLGYAGEFSFAYALMFGSSGYAAYEFMAHGMDVWPALLLGVVTSMVVGGLVALPAMRVRHLQLALVTFGAAIAGLEIFAHFSTDAGIVFLPTVSVAGHTLGIIDEKATTFVILCVLALAFIFTEIAVGGKMGRRWLLMKADESTARSIGVKIYRERIKAFVLSSVVLGAIGAIYPFASGILSPSPYELQTVIDVLIIAIIGGLLAPGGALLGALLFQLLYLEVNNAPAGLSQVVFGLVLLAVLAVLPRGLVGLLNPSERKGGRVFGSWGKALLVTSEGLIDEVSPSSTSQSPSELAARDVAVHEDGQSEAELGSNRDSVSAPRYALKATALSKHFGAFTAVDGVSLELLPGLVTGLIGANGAGKSTMLDLLTGFQKTETGEIELRDVDSNVQTNLTSRGATGCSSAGVVRTFQHSLLVRDLTVEDNVRVARELSLKRSRKNGVLAAMPLGSILEIAGISNYRREYPGSLPFGIIKLVDVARLLATAPHVALLDEPAAGLGAGETPYLEAVLSCLTDSGAAVMVIEHNLDFITKVSNHLYAMDFGKLIAEGIPGDVLSDSAVLTAYSVQARIGATSHDAS